MFGQIPNDLVTKVTKNSEGVVEDVKESRITKVEDMMGKFMDEEEIERRRREQDEQVELIEGQNEEETKGE